MRRRIWKCSNKGLILLVVRIGQDQEAHPRGTYLDQQKIKMLGHSKVL